MTARWQSCASVENGETRRSRAVTTPRCALAPLTQRSNFAGIGVEPLRRAGDGMGRRRHGLQEDACRPRATRSHAANFNQTRRVPS
jgi:hypothetical protein